MRQHTFMDRTFGRPDYDPEDEGDFERGLVFVMMSFVSNDSQEVYAAINDECQKLSLRPRRVDENVGSGLIISEITELIERAEFIICDLSDERPNVYYELGYAHGVGNEPEDVLLLAKQGTNLHFDVSPFRVQHYGAGADLRNIVSRNLREMIRIARGR